MSFMITIGLVKGGWSLVSRGTSTLGWGKRRRKKSKNKTILKTVKGKKKRIRTEASIDKRQTI